MALSIINPMITVPVAISKGGTGSSSLANNLRVPGPADDVSSGYSVGDYWNFNGTIYQNISNTASAAQWGQFPQDDVLLGDKIRSVLGSSMVLGAWSPYPLVSGYSGNAFTVTSASATTAVAPITNGATNFTAVDTLMSAGTVGVSTLNDQSGNGQDLTQTTYANMPLWQSEKSPGGKRSVFFSGQIPAVIAQTLANATLPISVKNNWSIILVLIPQCNKNNAIFNVSSDAVTFYNQQNYGFRSTTGAGGQFTHGQLQTSPVVLGISANAASLAVYTNDRTLTPLAVSIGTPALTGITFGTTSSYSSYFGQYELLAAVVMNTAMTAAQFNTIKVAAYKQFNITPQEQNVLTILGDSICAGTNGISPRTTARQLQTNLLSTASMRVHNQGVPSMYLSTILANIIGWSGNITTTGKNNIAIIQGGTNDLGTNPVTTTGSITGTTWTVTATSSTLYAGDKIFINGVDSGAVITSPASGLTGTYTISTPQSASSGITAIQTPYLLWTNDSILAGLLRGQGYKYVLRATLLPAGSGSMTDASRLSFNTTVRGLVGSVYDGVIDVGADPIMGQYANVTNALYYSSSDHTHPTDLGYQILQTVYKTALLPFLK